MLRSINKDGTQAEGADEVMAKGTKGPRWKTEDSARDRPVDFATISQHPKQAKIFCLRVRRL